MASQKLTVYFDNGVKLNMYAVSGGNDKWIEYLKTTSRKTDSQLSENQDHLGAPMQRNLTKTAYDRQ